MTNMACDIFDLVSREALFWITTLAFMITTLYFAMIVLLLNRIRQSNALTLITEQRKTLEMFDLIESALLKEMNQLTSVNKQNGIVKVKGCVLAVAKLGQIEKGLVSHERNHDENNNCIKNEPVPLNASLLVQSQGLPQQPKPEHHIVNVAA